MHFKKMKTMKKLAMLMVVMLMVTSASAQKAKVVSAFNYLKNGQLDKAKESIDPTITNETTMGLAKTWFYRGNVYLAIQLTDDPQYAPLKENALKTSHESYKRALELDTKGEFKEDILNRMMIIAEQYYNEGVNYYNENKYVDAANSFLAAKEASASIGRVDSLATYNYGSCAELSGNTDGARKAYEELVQLNYNNPLIYTSLSNIYLNAKDTATAFKVIADGKTKFPNDFNLLIAETNLYLATNQVAKAQINLEEALRIDNTNPTIFFAVGTTYDQMGQKDKAKESYKKAIEFKPDYFDAIYNLGALYVNEAAIIMDAANKLPLGDPKYDVEKKKADEMLKEATPYLEKAVELDPTEINTLVTLKEIYARTQQYDKLTKINELIDQANKK